MNKLGNTPKGKELDKYPALKDFIKNTIKLKGEGKGSEITLILSSGIIKGNFDFPAPEIPNVEKLPAGIFVDLTYPFGSKGVFIPYSIILGWANNIDEG